MKKTISILLVLVMSFAICACGAQPAAEKPQPQPAEEATYVMPTPAAEAVNPQTPEAQVELMFNNLAAIKMPTDAAENRYAVTDLDRNGRLELFGASTQGSSYFTTGKIFEVNESYNGFNEVAINLKEGSSLPEVIMEAADTYDDNGTFSYAFKDVTRDGSDTSYTVNSAISLKNGALNIQYLGQEKTVIINGTSAVEFYDANGKIIGPDEFNALNTVNGTKSSTNFDWFQLGEVTASTRLLSSYNIFKGNIQPPVVVPAATPAPTPTNSVIIVTPGFLMITKNPTWETRYVGDTCIFDARADNWDSCRWTFICNGTAYNAGQFSSMTGCQTNGGNDPALYVYNANKNLNNWTAYCTFYGIGNQQTAQTNTVGFTINDKQPVYNQTSGSYSSYGSDNFATAIYIPMIGNTVYVSPSLCNIDGVLYDGCPCTVYFTGNTPTGNSGGSIYRVDIYGGSGPTTHSCYGTIIGLYPEGNTAQISCPDGVFNYSLDMLPIGIELLNRGCTIYYTGDSPMSSEITNITIP